MPFQEANETESAFPTSLISMTLRFLSFCSFSLPSPTPKSLRDVRTTLSQGDFSAASHRTGDLPHRPRRRPRLPGSAFLDGSRLPVRQVRLDQADNLCQASRDAGRGSSSSTAPSMPNRTCRSRSAPPSKSRPRVLAARASNAQAVALLRHNLAIYGNTSLRARLQKNLNLLGLDRPTRSSAKHRRILRPSTQAARPA